MPLPKRQFLDPRPLREALDSPIEDAVNIPFQELNARSQELPRASEVVKIAAETTLAQEVAEWLTKGGRLCEVVPFEYTDRYAPGRLWNPHPLVEKLAKSQAPGSAWDLGCGSGRDSIYLASCGWIVVAIDRLADAIDRGRLTSKSLLGADAGNIEWRVQDVSEAITGQFAMDLALMLLFVDRTALRSVRDRLSPGGSVLLEAFTPTHRAQTGKPKDSSLTLDANEAQSIFEGFDFLQCEEAFHGNRHTLRLHCRKPGV